MVTTAENPTLHDITPELYERLTPLERRLADRFFAVAKSAVTEPGFFGKDLRRKKTKDLSQAAYEAYFDTLKLLLFSTQPVWVIGSGLLILALHGQLTQVLVPVLIALTVCSLVVVLVIYRAIQTERYFRARKRNPDAPWGG